MKEIKILESETVCLVKCPYNPDFCEEAKKNLNGRWDGSAWKFDIRDKEAVKALCHKIYGMDGETLCELVDVRIVAKQKITKTKKGIFFAGRCIASAVGRDTGAKLGEGVVRIGTVGSVRSGGSINNWATVIDAETELEVRDVPRTIVEQEDENWTIQIVRSGEDKIDEEALREERVRLVKRIADIDKLLIKDKLNDA